jgi:hypothetical protein
MGDWGKLVRCVAWQIWWSIRRFRPAAVTALASLALPGACLGISISQATRLPSLAQCMILIWSVLGAGAVVLAVLIARGAGWSRPAPWMSPGHPAWAGLHAVTAYHRRYLVPSRDLAGDAYELWSQASRAVEKIRRADVAHMGLIDTAAEVGAVLPYCLWAIAERLALLSSAEGAQSTILQDLDVSESDVAVMLDPRRRVRELTVADVKSRIRTLDEFATLAEQAARACKRNGAVANLATMNPDDEDLLALLPDTVHVLTAQDRAADEKAAVAAAASEAVRRVKAAARNLASSEKNVF